MVTLCLPLLIGRDSFLILNLLLDILDGVAGFNLQSDGFAREGFDEDLHGLVLNVVEK